MRKGGVELSDLDNGLINVPGESCCEQHLARSVPVRSPRLFCRPHIFI